MLRIDLRSHYSDHIGPILNPDTLKQIGDFFVNSILKSGIEFDAIAFRGNSGAILSGYLSLLAQKPLILVRKEKAHSDRKIETLIRPDSNVKYIVIDDLISTGNTIDDIIKTTESFFTTANLSGIFLYHSYLCEDAKEKPSSSFLHNGKEYPIWGKYFSPQKIRN